jgi:cytochrome c oxidase accessory protein FixG
MELVYRRIEYWIEGDWKQQQTLNKAPLDWSKLWKKTLKHTLFFAVAFIIGNTFLAYLIGSDRLVRMITDPVADHRGSLLALLGFSGVFYGVFAFMREQVCTTICPYVRLQGVLLDRHSTVIAYDHMRGEPRGLFRKGEDRGGAGKGDCIDCKACVHVCPTGIDIRNGTQLECVNCTACIDACDHMMTSVGLPTGLIRYASEREIADGKPWRFTTRMKAYTAVLTALVVVLLALILTRSDVEATVLRTPGTLFQKQDDGRISNLFNYKVVNKTTHDLSIHFKLIDVDGEVKVVGKELMLPKAELIEGEFFIALPPSEIQGYSTLVTVGVYSGDHLLDEVRASFVGPMTNRRRT